MIEYLVLTLDILFRYIDSNNNKSGMARGFSPFRRKMPTVKTRKNHRSKLFPVSGTIASLLEFFSYDRDFIIKRGEEDWVTETRYFLQPRTFEQYWLDPKISLGVRFGTNTKFGCVDLDKSQNNPHTNPKRYRKLLKALRNIGIKKTILIRSSNNIGVHLFYFLPGEVNSFDLACAMFRILSEHGFVIKPGELEIFPNTKRYKKTGEGFSLFNGLRVPLQPESGATLLDPKTFKPVSGGIEKFVELMKRYSTGQDFKLLTQKLSTAREWFYNLPSRTKGENKKQWQKDLEYRVNNGFTDSGQTNEILKDLANLGRVFHSLKTVTTLAQFICDTVTKLPGYELHCGHQPEIEKRCFEWATSAINYWSNWASYPERNQTYDQMWAEQEARGGDEPVACSAPKVDRGKWGWVNTKRHDETLNKLKSILKDYPLNIMPRQVLKRRNFINEKCQEMFGTKFSSNTLKKPEYRVLWHPKYTHNSDDAIATDKQTKPKKPGFSFKLAMGCVRAIAQKVIVTIELLINSNKRNTKKPRLEKKTSKNIQNTIAPRTCSIKQNKLDKTAETQVIQKVEQSDRTLMKCLKVSNPYLVYRVFILRLELVELKIKQWLEKLFTPKFKTSETKFEEVRKAIRGKAKRKNTYFYHGVEHSDSSNFKYRRRKLSEVYGSSKSVNKLQPGLKAGMKVKILTDYHSSSLSDDNRQILVYVRPIEIKTKEKYLVPLDNLIRVTSNSDSYLKVVLPQIKGLVIALGLTREDYWQHIQQTYGVERTGQLWPTEIFEVVTHFKNLFYNLFDDWSKVSNGSFTQYLNSNLILLTQNTQ